MIRTDSRLHLDQEVTRLPVEQTAQDNETRAAQTSAASHLLKTNLASAIITPSKCLWEPIRRRLRTATLAIRHFRHFLFRFPGKSPVDCCFSICLSKRHTDQVEKRAQASVIQGSTSQRAKGAHKPRGPHLFCPPPLVSPAVSSASAARAPPPRPAAPQV